MQYQAIGTHPCTSAFPSRPCSQSLDSGYNGRGRNFGLTSRRKPNLRAFPLREGKALVQGWVLIALLPAAAYAAVPVTPADAPVIQRAIAAQRGHVVLVNFWATWCAPCVAEFPAIVRTSRQYQSRGLRVVTVSADLLKDKNTKVAPFLTRSYADFPAFIEKSSDPETFIDAFDPAWPGDLPRTIIYDRSGHKVKVLAGPQTRRSLAAAVRPYLLKPNLLRSPARLHER